MKELAGKVAFVTGGASGIGLGIARACAASGMRIVLADIDEAELALAARALQQRADVLPVRLDVTDRAGWAEAAEQVGSTFGPVQLLANNAGVSTLGLSFDEVVPSTWDRVVDINLTGVYNGIHTFLPGMRAAGGGHIVNTSSVGGLIGSPLLAPYSATKSALVGLSESLRAELAGDGIGVSVLCPGGVRSRLWRTSRPIKGLPDTDVPPDDLTAQSALDSAMDADVVGRMVLASVVADEPYILTHPEFREAVAIRHHGLMRALDIAGETAG